MPLTYKQLGRAISAARLEGQYMLANLLILLRDIACPRS